MTTTHTLSKFIPQQKKIKELEKRNPRFKRVYSEYEMMCEQLWNVENTKGSSLPDDFVEAIKLQTEYLEVEVGDWLHLPEDH